ncbi:hypothetical protein NFJ68_06775 [Klebsiella aerogenes]|uniref:hypothetical protein n=1 Tax=Klebsiella aerogenes TaxID=548 RepID=UPI002433490E|nr:hypothetical protein [Klebsiella aerogenes]WFW28143.1 hypothetical protein NFJ68_06775 [Klebsiella aerogenes]
MEMIFNEDKDIENALQWLSKTLPEPNSLFDRMCLAQENYIKESALKVNVGKESKIEWHGCDVVAGFFSQAKSYLDNRRSCDISAASKILPWVKQLGVNVEYLNNIPGAVERAKRMLESYTVYPDNALFELILAGNYAAKGFDVEFIPEQKGIAKTPEFKCSFDGKALFVVECKRLKKGQYAQQEESAHSTRASFIESRVHLKRMSVWMDVTYKCEVNETPDDYLLKHLCNYYGKEYSWSDDYGSGFIKPANLRRVNDDIKLKGSLSLHTKLARLIKTSPLDGEFYNVYAFGRPDERDPRFFSKINYATLLTWRNVSEVSLENRSRHITKHLKEIEDQISNNGLGVGHLVIDADVQKDVADKRREKNIEAALSFRIKSKLVRLNIHYLVPRVDEDNSWLVDETLEFFSGDELISHLFPEVKLFSGVELFENDLPAWHQK